MTTTKRRAAFDKSAATLSLLAVVAGLGIGAAARTYAAPTAPSAAVEAPVAFGAAAPTIVVVRRGAAQPVARTRAS
jgi:hypothetical protein